MVIIVYLSVHIIALIYRVSKESQLHNRLLKEMPENSFLSVSCNFFLMCKVSEINVMYCTTIYFMESLEKVFQLNQKTKQYFPSLFCFMCHYFFVDTKAKFDTKHVLCIPTYLDFNMFRAVKIC